MKNLLSVFGLWLLLLSMNVDAAIIYVDSSHVGGTQNGTSWSTAFSDFQNGINAASAGDSVWVAKGTYKPALNAAFSMKDSVMIFGGFVNTNTAFAQRNVQNNLTILKGNGSRVINNDLSTPGMMHATELNGFTITGGQAIQGGGIYNNYASPSIINCIFKDNMASSDGGGGAWYNLYSNSICRNCVFENNTGASGGAIQNSYSSILIADCSFINNNTLPNPLIFTNCGGIVSNISTVVITGCNFEGNTGKYGGCVYMKNSYVTITDCIFTNNSASKNGGCIDIDGSNPTVINNCTFLNNTSELGGAIYNVSDTTTVTNCNFSGNKALRGGALCFPLINYSKIHNCFFTKDTALADGGAIYIKSNQSSIANCIFTENVADSLGAAIYTSAYFIIQSPLYITNSTFVKNIAPGNIAAIYAGPGARTRIRNSIVYNNSGGTISQNIADSISIAYSLVQGQPASVVNHNLNGNTNPLFVDMPGGNYRLKFNSPCVNKGSNDSITAGITTDFAGNARIWDNTVDMGAYEYIFAVDFGRDTMICSGVPLTLDAGNEGSVYLWNTGATTQTISVNSSGQYSVAITNSFGTIMDTINVNVVPSPVVSLGNDTIINMGSSLMLNAGNAGASYQWNTGATTQTITVTTAGAYIVTVTNSEGCTGVDTIMVNVAPLGIKDANANPNAFIISPNPAKDIIHINITDPKLLHTKALLTDAYGRIVREIKINDTSQLFSLSGLAPGIYILKMENAAAVKIVKE